MAKLHVGQIDYLNCYPFYYHFEEKQPLEKIDIFRGHPSELNQKMLNGELDLSPVSAGCLGDLNDRVQLLPDFCLSSIGYVRSVILISRYPIEELDHKKIGLTSSSKTSITMIKILLQKYYGLEPNYVQANAFPSLKDYDAAVVIGNNAMLEPSEPVPYVYDLGDLWLRKTGYPVVFAVFTVQKNLDAEKQQLVLQMSQSYHQSLACLETDRDRIIKLAHEHYPEIRYDIAEYYNLLKFNMTDQLKEALAFFLKEAGELEFIPKVKEISYYQ